MNRTWGGWRGASGVLVALQGSGKGGFGHSRVLERALQGSGKRRLDGRGACGGQGGCYPLEV